MPVFQYTVRDATGNMRTGTSEAENQDILKRRLQEQGFQVNDVKQTGKSKTKNAASGYGKVKLKDLSIFCRQFSTMIDAGVSLVRSLDVLGEQTQNPKLKRILREIQVEVESGQQLSKAMQKYPKVFSNLFVGLIRAGEVGGVLEEALQRLSGFLEKDMELRRKVKAALTYPIIVVIVAITIVLFLCTYIVPAELCPPPPNCRISEPISVCDDRFKILCPHAKTQFCFRSPSTTQIEIFCSG